MKRGLKILLGILLATNIIFAGNFAFGVDSKPADNIVLNLNYPDIPGLGRLSDYKKLDESLRIGFILNYIFKLVFFLSIGLGFVALIASGVFYIVSLSKPRWLTLAKQMAKNAMLGLFILLLAYLLLYAINPQLLSLSLQKPELNIKTDLTANKYEKGTIVVQQAPFSQILTEAVEGLATKIYLAKDGEGKLTGQYYEIVKDGNVTRYCLTDGFGTKVNSLGVPIKDLPKEEQDKIKNGCVPPAIMTSKDGEPADPFVYRAEIEIRESAKIVRDVSAIVKEINPLLQECKCGDSLGYNKGQECKPGLNPDGATAAKYKDNIKNGDYCLNQCKDCGTSKLKFGFPSCDLRDVRKNIKTSVIEVCLKKKGCSASDPCWKEIAKNIDNAIANITVASFSQVQIDGTDPSCVGSEVLRVAGLIKLKSLKIQALQAKLEARSRLSANFLDSLTLVGKGLDANRIEYLTSQAKGLWAYDFSYDLKELEKNYNVVIEPYGGATQPPKDVLTENQTNGNVFLSRLKNFIAPFALAIDLQHQYVGDYAGTFFFITQAPPEVQSEEITAKNKAIARNAQRFNLFSVLTGLSLENIEGIFRDCLAAAFGEATYVLTNEQIEQVVKMATSDGSIEHLKAALTKKLNEIAQATADGAKQGIIDDTTVQFIGKFANECRANGFCTGEEYDTNEEVALKVAPGGAGGPKEGWASALSDTCVQCVKNLMDNHIPPRFVSNTIAGFFTFGLDEAFPNISATLDKDVRDVLFPADKKIGAFLDMKMIDVYDTILKGALLTPIDEKIPGLDTLLDKQMKDVLPDFISGQIEGINGWFTNTVSSTKSMIRTASNKFEQNLTDTYIKQPLEEWRETKFDQMGIGTKHLTINGCFDQLKLGYIFKEPTLKEIQDYNKVLNGNEPGQCVKMTAEEINNLFDKVPMSFNYTGPDTIVDRPIDESKPIIYYTGAFADAENICKAAGYTWMCGLDVTKNEDWDIPKYSRSKDNCTCEDIDDVGQDVRAGLETIQDPAKFGTAIKAGAIRYVEGLTIAFTETALRGALAYARVFVEDELITPLLATWNSITGFQQNIQWFMQASVKDILPSQIADLLQGNLASQIEKFCDFYEIEKEKLKGAGGDVEINLGIDLPKGVTWDNSETIKPTVKVSQNFGDKICGIESTFDTSTYDQLLIAYARCKGTDLLEKSEFDKDFCRMMNFMELPLGDALEQVCFDFDGKRECLLGGFKEWFDKGGTGKSLVSLLFPHFDSTSIVALVNATPKDLICGKVTLNGMKPEGKCAFVFGNKYGIIPIIDSAKAKLAGDIMPLCYFQNYACKTPLSDITGGETEVGGFIKKAITFGCTELEVQLNKGECSGKCFCQYDCPSGIIASGPSCGTQKDFCKACSALAKNHIFYNLLYETVKNETNKENIIKFYVDMWNYFPTLEADIKAVVKNLEAKHAIKWADVEAQKAKGGFGFSSLFSLFSKGIDKGISVPDLRSLLNQEENLSQTPYGFIKNTFCKNITNSFESQYPDYTFSNFESIQAEKIWQSLPYSRGSVDTVSFADTYRAFANSEPGKSDLGQAYLLCNVLDKTPQELFGLDQLLKSYIRPEEYIILFDLLDQELSSGSQADCQKGESFIYEGGQGFCCDPTLGVGKGLCYKVGERPASLNLLLDYMSNNTPISALEKIQQQASSDNKIYPFAFYIYTPGNCLQVGKPISNCSGSVPSVFVINGFKKTDVVGVSSKKVVIVEGIGSTGMEVQAYGKLQKDGTDYLLYRDESTDLVFIFKDAGQTVDEFGQLLKYMQTPLGDILDTALGKETLANMICNKLPAGVCDTKIDKNFKDKLGANYIKFEEILGAIPVDIAEKYLKQKMSLPELFGVKNDVSLMDALANNNALDQRLLDTLGSMTGWDQLLFGGVDAAKKKAAWADAGAMKGIEAIQNGLQTALVDWPKEAGQAIAGFFGLELGTKEATEIGGACYPKTAEDCKAGEVERKEGIKDECCILARAQACQPRCRVVDDKIKQCDVVSGEMPKPTLTVDGVYVCCFNKTETGKDAKGDSIYQCFKDRAINKEAGAVCRAQDESGKKDPPYEIETSCAAGTCCRYKEDYSPSETVALPIDEKVKEFGYCCSTVSQCVSNRLSSHLETLAEMIADGKVPLKSLKEK